MTVWWSNTQSLSLCVSVCVCILPLMSSINFGSHRQSARTCTVGWMVKWNVLRHHRLLNSNNSEGQTTDRPTNDAECFLKCTECLAILQFSDRYMFLCHCKDILYKHTMLLMMMMTIVRIMMMMRGMGREHGSKNEKMLKMLANKTPFTTVL